MQAILWQHAYSIFNFHFKSQNVGQEGQKLQKCEYFKNQKSLLGKIKGIFHDFFKGFILVKF